MKRRTLSLAVVTAVLSTPWLMAQPAPRSMADEFRLVEVASVSDAMEQLYGQRLYMSHEMRPLAPAKFAGPAVTPAVDARVVPIFLEGTLQHELQVADERIAPRIRAAPRPARGNQRLVQVQRHRARAARTAKIDAALVQEYRAIASASCRRVTLAIPPRDVGQTVDEFRQIAHRRISAPPIVSLRALVQKSCVRIASVRRQSSRP